jgi:hypothetical protein
MVNETPTNRNYRATQLHGRLTASTLSMVCRLGGDSRAMMATAIIRGRGRGRNRERVMAENSDATSGKRPIMIAGAVVGIVLSAAGELARLVQISLALASWCETRGGMRKIGGAFSG